MVKNKNNDKNTLVTVGILDDAVNIILQGMDNMAKELRGDIKQVDDKVVVLQKYVDHLKDDMVEVKNDIHWTKDDISGIKTDHSYTPSIKEIIEFHSGLMNISYLNNGY